MNYSEHFKNHRDKRTNWAGSLPDKIEFQKHEVSGHAFHYISDFIKSANKTEQFQVYVLSEEKTPIPIKKDIKTKTMNRNYLRKNYVNEVYNELYA